jgi:hypothetical protein
VRHSHLLYVLSRRFSAESTRMKETSNQSLHAPPVEALPVVPAVPEAPPAVQPHRPYRPEERYRPRRRGRSRRSSPSRCCTCTPWSRPCRCLSRLGSHCRPNQCTQRMSSYCRRRCNPRSTPFLRIPCRRSSRAGKRWRPPVLAIPTVWWCPTQGRCPSGPAQPESRSRHRLP